MRATLAMLVAGLILAGGAGCSGIDPDDVQDTAAAVKGGEGVMLRKDYPSDDIQLYAFSAGSPLWRTQLWYIIDLRAHLCYSTLSRSETSVLTPVPCKALKNGYPLIAPLITWDETTPAPALNARIGSFPGLPSNQAKPNPPPPAGPGPAQPVSPGARPAGR